MAQKTAEIVLPSPDSPSVAPSEDAVGWDTNGGPTLGKLDVVTSLGNDESPFAKLRMMEECLWLSQKLESSDETNKTRNDGETDKSLTFLQCCRKYPKALAWSGVLLMAIVMMAYSKLLIGAVISLPVFENKFGDKDPNDLADGHLIRPLWQFALKDASLVAEIVGLMICGPLTGVIGYKKMMICSLAWTCIGVFPAVFAQNLATLLASQLICGLSWGVIEILAFMYAAELVPSRLRAFVLSNVNTCWLLGQLLSTGVLTGLSSKKSDEVAIRLPFILQWVWAVPPLIAFFFLPESPWWLVRRGRSSDARLSLRRLASKDSVDADVAVAMMKHTNKVEKRLNYGGARFRDMFKTKNRRRTEIACMIWICQALSGSSISSYAPYLMQRAGLDGSASITFSTIMYGIAIGGAICSLFVIQYVGRRTLYLWGLGSAVLFLTVAGIVSVVLPPSIKVGWTLTALIIVTNLTYDLTIGPVCYVLVAEIPAMRLRLNTVALGRITYNVIKIISHIIMPKMANPTEWDWKGKVCFVFAGTSLICLVWCYFRLPETKGLSHVELDILFELGAPAKKFSDFRKKLENTPYVSSADEQKNPWHGWLSYA
ncbi:hypothetical protein XA68_17208 [Ophiocordyceps unilateralis]|uniref:Major facilitator superfamily (MFS) profile domain-containing protein n=1 Tax=Ophiocordyceps unilateralis TaxID=268505 RepID=A0A2A9PKS0_OPHUN|nr:hypothetical protein XA68_17208 [Ophiocordyceps unilateralis]